MATSYPLDLAGGSTASAAGAGTAAASAALPGYMTSMGNIGTNIASETAGQVPADVINQLKQQGAESNVSTGAASNASYLKALGLTSLGLQEQGEKDLTNILPSVPGFNISQNPEFQTSSNLAYEEQLQPQVFQRQDQQQQFALQQQQAALKAAQLGLNRGGSSWNLPTNAWSGVGRAGSVDSLGFPTDSTATLPGQTTSSGVTNPGGAGTAVVYGPGGGPNVPTGPVDYSGLNTGTDDYSDAWSY